MDTTFKKIIDEYIGELYVCEWEEIWEEINKHYIRRPLDKYGETIYIGDSVWVGEHRWPKEVKELRLLGDKNLVVFKDGFECQACEVFHSRPIVLDAGGRILEHGDTVWRLNDGVQGTVVSLNEEKNRVKCLFQDYPWTIFLDSGTVTKKFWS